MQRHRLVVLLGLFGLAAAGCGPPPTPSSFNVYRHADFKTSDLAQKTILLVSDVCVARSMDKDRKPYICLCDSRRAIDRANQSVVAYFAAHGGPLPLIGPSGIGGAMQPKEGSGKKEGKDAQESPEVSRYPRGPGSKAATQPFWLSKEWGHWDADKARSLEACLASALWKAPATKTNLEKLATDDAFRSACKELQARYRCDYILLVVMVGQHVDENEQLKAAQTQMAVTGALTAGMFMGFAVPASFFQARVALVDASASRVVWANTHADGGNNSHSVSKLFGPQWVFELGGDEWCASQTQPATERPTRYFPSTQWYTDFVLENIQDIELREWANRPCNVFWVLWARQLVYHLLPQDQKKAQ